MPINTPEPLTIPPDQKKGLTPHIARFKNYAASPQFARGQEHRQSQQSFFREAFPKRLAELAEPDVVDLVSHLWAAQIFGNKQYLASKIVTENGLDNLKTNLLRLLDASLSVAKRYDDFRANISYLGPAAVTEIMCNMEPHRCGVWNSKARQGLQVLGLGALVNPNLYHIAGHEYERFNRLLAALAIEIESAGLPNVDLLYVDYFLYDVTQASRAVPTVPPVAAPSAHDEVCDMLYEVGLMLGFESSKEVFITHGAKVDVLWRVRIGNLGTVTYVFEVQSGGSIDSLILNLQRAKSDPTVQKVVAVSDEQQLARIQREVEALPSEFRNSLSFMNIDQVKMVSENLQSAMGIINNLGLAPGVQPK